MEIQVLCTLRFSDELLAMTRHRISGRARLLVATGCLSQRFAAELTAEMPELDHVIDGIERAACRQIGEAPAQLGAVIVVPP